MAIANILHYKQELQPYFTVLGGCYISITCPSTMLLITKLLFSLKMCTSILNGMSSEFEDANKIVLLSKPNKIYAVFSIDNDQHEHNTNMKD
jgi:hypothetical protein